MAFLSDFTYIISDLIWAQLLSAWKYLWRLIIQTNKTAINSNNEYVVSIYFMFYVLLWSREAAHGASVAAPGAWVAVGKVKKEM